MAPIQTFIDSFNKGDGVAAAATHAAGTDLVIIDEVPPYVWRGAKAFQAWSADLESDAKKNAITEPMVTIGAVTRIESNGDQSYVVVPAVYTFKQRGAAMRETAQMTFVLSKGPPAGDPRVDVDGAEAAARHGIRQRINGSTTEGHARRRSPFTARTLPVTPAVVSVVVMYAAFTVVGWLASRKVRNGTAADLIVAGRQMPLWIAALTMTATWVDGGYLLGTAEAAYKSSIQLGIQGGLCFGISLILGGLFFARTMRRHGFTTLIDPFEARFGKRWAAILFLPALAGELFWSAELLVALGSAFDVLLGMNLTTAILMAAIVTTVYTMLGGMWSVAYTDVFQLGLVAIGLAAALPFALDGAGGLEQSWLRYAHARPDGHGIVPGMFAGRGMWSTPAVVSWWDVSLMLMLGGIPWNCYFQRVLSCTSPAKAAGQSIVSGVLTIGFTVPPLLMGIAAFSYPWPAETLARLQANPAETLPLLFAHAVPPLVGILGLAAIIGAVTSSFSSSILSAGSMLSWNCLKRLMWPSLTVVQMARVIRLSILVLARRRPRSR